MHFALLSTVLLLSPLAAVSASANVHASRQEAAIANRHREMTRRGNRGLGEGMRKEKRTKRGNEATLKCLTRYTFALCDGDNCTDMGAVAAGTACVNNAIQYDDAAATRVPVSHPSKSCDDNIATSQPIKVIPTSTKSHHHGASKSWKKPSSVANAVVAAVTPVTTSAEAAPEVTSSSSSSSSSSSTEAVAAVSTPVVVQAAVVIPTTTSSAASSGPTDSANGPFTGGFATFFYQGGAYGACGKIHADSDKIVALQIDRYGTGSNNAPDCGRTVMITNEDNGKTTTATVADACPGCTNYNSLDLSTGAFDAIADQSTGIIPISWYYVN